MPVPFMHPPWMRGLSSKALSGRITLLSLHLNVEAIPQPDALMVVDECNLKSVETPDLEEGLMSGDFYVV